MSEQTANILLTVAFFGVPAFFTVLFTAIMIYDEFTVTGGRK